MTNVISWTEAEIDILVQAWSEVDAKYPLLRCPRGAGTLHSKVFALYSKRCTFPRSSSAVNHTKHSIRNFVLFVHKFNEDRRKDGGREWFDLSDAEKKQFRPLLERRLWGLAFTIKQKTFARLMAMDRAHRWLGEVGSTNDRPSEIQVLQAGSTTALAQPIQLSPLSESSSLSTERNAEKGDEQVSFVTLRSRSNSCSSQSSGDDGKALEFGTSKNLPRISPSATELLGKPKPVQDDSQICGKIKHRECGILLESMMQLQEKKMSRAVTKLRASIEDQIHRSSEMLNSIISNQFDDPGSSGDVAFMAKVLNMQKQQVCDRFDQFEENRAHEEAANRALLK
ncbi:hypothetical protein PHMEG_00019444 [Phytophthora megakarya]|uniref:Uncharacterized protein n=1 Tax=Phytophthora megakarya TaxID=4795 RepID=A0A225VSD9_9STRA|nr:hypothetical protein PHMEG_00019444 [Phytophthora megakarya]